MDFLFRLFDPSGFPPRWLCGPGWAESPWLGWLHVLSDLGVWTAYFAIPMVLAYFVVRRRDLPFRGIFVLFVSFILLCGLTHLVDAVVFWWPVYRFAGVVKLATAVISWTTVFALIRVVPGVLGMKSPGEMEVEIAARRTAEAALQSAYSGLEKRVEERTNELARAVKELARERELLRTTLASIGEGVIATDTRGRVTYLNGMAETLTGWTSDAAEGKPLEAVFHVVSEETRKTFDNAALEAVEAESIVGRKTRGVLIARDGTERPVEDSTAPIQDGQGNVTGAVLIFRDVAERRLIEEAQKIAQRELEKRVAERTAELSQANEFLKALLDNVQDGIVACGADGRLTLFNRVTRELHGLPETTISPERWPEHYSLYYGDGRTPLPPEDVPLSRALRGERIREAEMVIAAPGRAPRNLLASGQAFYDAKGAKLGAVVSMHDITARKRAEEALRLAHQELEQRVEERTVDLARANAALRAREAELRHLADAMPQMVWITTPDGAPVYYNRRWYDFFGVPPEECLGEKWYQLLHPEDRERARERWAYAVRTGEPYEIEYRFRSREGHYRWFLGRGLPIRDEAGTIVKWFGTCTDIEEFKRIEADHRKFVSLAENSTDFIGIYDLSGVPLYVNKAGLELVGLADMEEARRTPFRDYFFPEDQARVLEEFIPQIRERGHGEIEIRLRHFLSGRAIWMTSNVFKVTDVPGGRASLATVSRDITDRRHLEDSLRQLAANLSEADRRKDEFLATLAHELRNPLAPISNGLQILKLAGGGGELIEEARGMMERQLAQMVRLVDDLLDVSRITRNKLELRRERIDLAAVLHSAIETSRPLIDAEGHHLDVRIPQETIFLDADLTRLSQVFSNLLSNAAKYTEPGGRIALSAARQGDDVVVSVTDTGLGIPPEMLPKVFDMFTQVERNLGRAQGGLGIGLTLVRRLVEMHGGEVRATSPGVGHGSTFVVRLPLAPAASQGEAPHGEQAGEETPRDKTLRRILIVDDNVDAAKSLGFLMRMRGDEVRIVHDGEAAVEAARAFDPDVILLDIGLPKLNGHEACQAIRRDEAERTSRADADRPVRRTVIIACSGWGQEEDRRRSRESGFDHHLVKPVDTAELQRILENTSVRSGEE